MLPHIENLYNFSRWLTRNTDDAEELVHDAISSVVMRKNSYEPGTNIKGFLITVIRRLYINRLRRDRYEVTSAGYPEDQESISSGDGAGKPLKLAQNLIRRDIGRAMEGISPDHRMVIVLADVEEYSLAEIAEIMGIPVGTVKSKLWRARAALREKLAEYQE